jgi:hypothetical protein
MAREARHLSLDEFLAEEGAPRVSVGTHFNGGAFMDCHCRVFSETGIWIEELVPVFQKLDSHLAAASERTVKELSPKFA